MTQIANLVAKISADTANFDRGMNSVGASIARFAARMAVAAGSGGIGLGLFTHRVVSAIDDLQDFGARINYTTQDMIKLQSISQNYGFSLQTLVQGIGHMQVAAVKASEGNKKMADAFSDLGINVAEFQKLEPWEKLQKVGEQLSKIKDESKRAAIAVLLFGESAGLVFQGVLSDGGKELERAAKATARFGELTEKQLGNVAKYDAAWTNLKDSFGSLSRQIGATLGGPMAELLGYVDRNMPSMVQKVLIFAGGVMAWYKSFELIAQSIADVLRNISGLERLFDLAKSASSALSPLALLAKYISSIGFGAQGGAATAFAAPEVAAGNAALLFRDMFVGTGITPTIEISNAVIRTGENSYGTGGRQRSVTINDVSDPADKKTEQIVTLLREGNVIWSQTRDAVRGGVPAVAQ